MSEDFLSGKRSKIKTSEVIPDIEGCVKADDNLATSEVPTVDEIINAMLQKEESDEYIEEKV
jgi:hypothetical protein